MGTAGTVVAKRKGTPHANHFDRPRNLEHQWTHVTILENRPCRANITGLHCRQLDAGERLWKNRLTVDFNPPDEARLIRRGIKFDQALNLHLKRERPPIESEISDNAYVKPSCERVRVSETGAITSKLHRRSCHQSWNSFEVMPPVPETPRSPSLS
jgi:hypothetical protein